jgi:PAS domain S-box-containing protein
VADFLFGGDDEATYRAQLAAIVDSSDDVIVSKTLDGIIKSWNRAAERLFGWTADEAVGKHITLIIPKNRLSEEDDVLARLRRGERVDHFETVRQRKDGSLVDVSITVSPVRDGTGRIVGASKIARDITERRRIEQEREDLLARAQRARLDAERANRAKDDFLATLSHELRTPLNAILGWTNVLSTARRDPDMIDRAVETITRNAKQQARLIEDLLDISAILSGKLRLDIRPVDLEALLTGIIDSVRPAANAKGIRLGTRFTPAAGQMRGDPERLQQVFWNLLSNAIKFTETGGRVDVTLEFTADRAVIRVSDTGIGIHPDVLPVVFERFRQADSSITRSHGGLGLGLAIAKQLVEMHGGRVEAASLGEGRGTTMTVTLRSGMI